jgi:hypothetical protein
MQQLNKGEVTLESFNSFLGTSTHPDHHSGLCFTHCRAVLEAIRNGQFLLARRETKAMLCLE